MERHSGSQIIMAGGIGTVTEDIPEMDGSSWMVSGICLIGSGYMLTGWQNVGGTWYYLHGNGVMGGGTQWVSDYYVNGSGAMLANTWTPDGYWVNESEVETPQWHDAVYDDKWVVDKEAWTERKPVIVYDTHAICYCGFGILIKHFLIKYGEDAFVGHWNTGEKFMKNIIASYRDVTTHECP